MQSAALLSTCLTPTPSLCSLPLLQLTSTESRLRQQVRLIDEGHAQEIASLQAQLTAQQNAAASARTEDANTIAALQCTHGTVPTCCSIGFNIVPPGGGVRVCVCVCDCYPNSTARGGAQGSQLCENPAGPAPGGNFAAPNRGHRGHHIEDFH